MWQCRKSIRDLNSVACLLYQVLHVVPTLFQHVSFGAWVGDNGCRSLCCARTTKTPPPRLQVIPDIAADFGVTERHASWTVLLPHIVVAAVNPAAGKVADVLGRKEVWVGGTVLNIII